MNIFFLIESGDRMEIVYLIFPSITFIFEAGLPLPVNRLSGECGESDTVPDKHFSIGGNLMLFLRKQGKLFLEHAEGIRYKISDDAKCPKS